MTDSSNMTDRMFDFLSGDPDEILTYKDIGVLPWWTDDTLKVRFWRPLSAITHVLDYALWPERSEWMHIHNVAWLALLIGSTAALYRRLITMPLVAGLAALLYALDDAHGMPVAFLANRNALVATSFGVLSLWCHDRFRRDGWTPGMVLSPLAFLAALLGGESGIGAAPYGAASLQAKFLHGVEPRPHDLWVADRSDAATVLREEGTLWNHVESSKQRQALVEDVTHDMAVPSAAEQLHRQQ